MTLADADTAEVSASFVPGQYTGPFAMECIDDLTCFDWRVAIAPAPRAPPANCSPRTFSGAMPATNASNDG